MFCLCVKADIILHNVNIKKIYSFNTFDCQVLETAVQIQTCRLWGVVQCNDSRLTVDVETASVVLSDEQLRVKHLSATGS